MSIARNVMRPSVRRLFPQVLSIGTLLLYSTITPHALRVRVVIVYRYILRSAGTSTHARIIFRKLLLIDA